MGSGIFDPTEKFEDLLGNSMAGYDIKESSIVEGKIVAISRDHVAVDVGIKGEGLIDIREFANQDGEILVKIGDVVEVVLEAFEGMGGKVILSRQKVVKEKVWQTLKEQMERGEIVEGYISGKVKGGYTVDMGDDIIAFLPGSQVDVRQTDDIGVIAAIKQSFKILKMDEIRGNIVLSRRAVLEKAHKEKVKDMLAQIKVGDIVEGVVKNITVYGAFIDLGYFDGLAHIRDLAWSRISSPSEVLRLGDKTKFVVTGYDPDKQQVTLGLKQLTPSPWAVSSDKYKIGDVYQGRVSNITDYGIFVSFSEGMEGLVHVSEFSWSKSVSAPRKVYHIGDKVTVKIVDIDHDKHRVSLSIKQCLSNPWQEFADKHKEGDIVEGSIRNMADFGIFVGLEEGVDGLVHISDTEWDPRGRKNKIKDYRVDQQVKAMVMSIDVSKERIALSFKHLTENPYKEAFAGLEVGKIITCTVKEVRSDDIIVSINDKLSAVVKKYDLSKERTQQRPDRFQAGEEVEAKVMSLDPDNGKVDVSIRFAEGGEVPEEEAVLTVFDEALQRAEQVAEKKNSEEK